jgi:hypothetical protein
MHLDAWILEVECYHLNAAHPHLHGVIV